LAKAYLKITLPNGFEVLLEDVSAWRSSDELTEIVFRDSSQIALYHAKNPAWVVLDDDGTVYMSKWSDRFEHWLGVRWYVLMRTLGFDPLEKDYGSSKRW